MGTGKRRKTISDYILEHPLLSLGAAMLSFALAFSQRSSVVATLVCIAVAALIFWDLIVGTGRVKGWAGATTYGLSCASLVLCLIFGLWLIGAIFPPHVQQVFSYDWIPQPVESRQLYCDSLPNFSESVSANDLPSDDETKRQSQEAFDHLSAAIRIPPNGDPTRSQIIFTNGSDIGIKEYQASFMEQIVWENDDREANVSRELDFVDYVPLGAGGDAQSVPFFTHMFGSLPVVCADFVFKFGYTLDTTPPLKQEKRFRFVLERYASETRAKQ